MDGNNKDETNNKKNIQKTNIRKREKYTQIKIRNRDEKMTNTPRIWVACAEMKRTDQNEIKACVERMRIRTESDEREENKLK